MSNTIVGAAGGGTLTGTSGDDVFKLEGGAYTVNGGGGVDTVDLSDAPVAVTVDLSQGSVSGWGSAVLNGVSNIVGSSHGGTLIGGPTTTYIASAGGAATITGGPMSALLVGGAGSDTITGGAGNDNISPGGGDNIVDGAGGYNSVVYTDQPGPVTVDLYAGAWHPGGFDTLKNITNIYASNYASTLKGDFQQNILVGGSGDDTILAREGNDVLQGGGGNDLLDGGPGHDKAIYSGAHSDYVITANAYGWVVTDTRPGAPDGVDVVRNVEDLQFSDTTISLPNDLAVDPTVKQAIANLLQEGAGYDSSNGVATSPASALGVWLTQQLQAGSLDVNGAVATVLKDAGDTTSVATLAYQFFTGAAPSAAGMNYLIAPDGPNANNLNSDYYQHFSEENRFINFAVNLGKSGEGAASYQSAYGPLSLHDALSAAYSKIFGTAPSAAKIDAILNAPVPDGLGGSETRAAYFAFYGQDGANGLGAKAAMVGWLLAEAVKGDVGTYALSNDAFLTDVALHNAPYGVDIVGHYAQAGFAYTGG